MASVPSKSEMQDSAGKTAVKAEATAHDIAQAAKTHIDSAGDAVGDLYARGAGNARETLGEMPASFSSLNAAGESLALRGRQALDQGVRKQPVEALLLAGAIGYLVGWAFSRG